MNECRFDWLVQVPLFAGAGEQPAEVAPDNGLDAVSEGSGVIALEANWLLEPDGA